MRNGEHTDYRKCVQFLTRDRESKSKSFGIGRLDKNVKTFTQENLTSFL